MRRLLIALAVMFAAAPLGAQNIDYDERARDLEDLSRIFGELHHIRRMCERDENQIWRNRMRRLVELEDPQPALRRRMVEAFNNGYYSAEKAFPYCDRDARDHAAALAADGDRIAADLAAPLYKTLGESGTLPEVVRGNR